MVVGVSRSGVDFTLSGDVEAALQFLSASQRSALLNVEHTSDDLRKAQSAYERAVIVADSLGCGPSAIGSSAGRSESTIRGFLRRRKEAA